MRPPPSPRKAAGKGAEERVASVEDELSRRVLERDVANAYALLLGRAPESPAVAQEKARLSRLELLCELLAADEFQGRVLDPILEGRPLQGLMFDAPPGVATLQWAAEVLPLSDAHRAALPDQKSWYGAYATIFGDDAVLQAFGDASPRLLEPALLDRLRRRLEGQVDREIVGALEEVSPGRLSGWALDKAHPDARLALEVLVDGAFVAAGTTGRFRRELQDIHGGQGLFGFELTGLPLSADDTRAGAEVEVRDAATRTLIGRAPLRRRWDRDVDHLRQLREDLSQVKAGVARIEAAFNAVAARFGHALADYDDYRRAVYARTPLVEEADRQTRLGFSRTPLISVALLVDAAGVADLRSSLASLAQQTYERWEVLLAMQGLPEEQAGECEREARQALGETVRILDDPEQAATASKGEYVVFLRAGDRLSPDAVQAVVARLQGAQLPVLLYADEDRVDVSLRGETYASPRFKPAYDYDLQLQTGYIGDLLALSRDALDKAVQSGGRTAPDRRLDLVLRVLEATPPEQVVHIPRVLYHAGRAPEAPDRVQAALAEAALAEAAQEHFRRTGVEGQASPHVDELHATVAGAVRIQRTRRLDGVRAAVIIPTRDRLDLIGPCVASLMAASAHNRVELEIIVVDNGGALEAGRAFLGALAGSSRIRVISDEAPFNWGALNNNAARLTEADVLIFQNDDTVMLTRDGLDELCGQAMREEVGAVGPRLLFEDGTIQHAGVVVGGRNGVAYHEGLGMAGDDAGYLGRHALLHRASAVTGACLVTRSDVFRRLGGFDEHGFAVEAGDIDYCLRVQQLGLAVLYDPYVTLYHFESKTRGQTGADPKRRERAERELDRLRTRWGDRLADDPWYNPHFDRFSRPFAKLGTPGR